MTYQVVGECAHVEVQELGGTRSMQMLYKGAPVPAGVSADRLKHLLDNGLIAEMGATPIAPNAAVQQDPARGLDAVTVDVLRGGKPEEPRTDPALGAADRIRETVTDQGAIDKATEPSKADQELAEKRAAARAKLPDGGAEPDGRAGQAVWVEYLVGRGQDYDAVKDADKADLIKLAKQQS
ncbi:hypothetical protein [Actinoplanes rectilineatus]|uniref:hypothetical protein n=1 Tax=Actinoplanes rectilineatus TaxID=113571 RepID=UPI0005F2ABEB|nr:hypothetical protein [Actinoplanes rectilineatus]